MPVIKTETIWTAFGSDIGARPGELILDDDQQFEYGDRQGPFYVADGLQSRDLAAFLSYYDVDSGETVGYLVTRVNKDGSGILVAGDLFEASPPSWVNPRIAGLWGMLAVHGYSPDEFSLPNLARYLERSQAA